MEQSSSVYSVDLLWRRTVVASNFISIERFSRKSKSNGGINISLYGRVPATLSRRASRFSIGLFPSPLFSMRIKARRETATSPRATNQPWNSLLETPQNIPADRRNNYSLFALILSNRLDVNEYNDAKCLRVISMKVKTTGWKSTRVDEKEISETAQLNL